MKSKTLVCLKKKIVADYIKKNPNCTNKDIKKDTKVKLERIGWNMEQAYKTAGVRLSKNLTKRNIKEQKHDVIDFIRGHPGCTVTDMQSTTKVNVMGVFGSVVWLMGLQV